MSQQAPRTIPALWALLLSTLALASPLGAAEGGLRLVERGGTAHLELPAGDRIEIALTTGSELTAAVALREGWLAVGTRRTEGGSELLLLAGDDRNVSPLPVPAGPSGRLRHGPVPLVAAGELAGLAWLEGRDGRSLAVRFASWEGDGWGAPRTVAAPGPGSQMALAAAALADGSWLLAWTRFDGADDEIVWSRSRGPLGETWTPPRRIAADNAVPDVTPALLATRDGVLAAWSRYDGEHYRVVTALFDGRAWSPPRAVGPAGSLYPSWEAPDDGPPTFLARTAAPRGWLAIEVDDAGRMVRSAAAAASEAERPVIERADGGVTFRWLGVGDDDQEKDQARVPWAELR